VKYVLRTLGVLVLGAVLAGCSSEIEPVTLETQAAFITSKTWVSSNLKFSPPTTNCVSTEFYSLEQGRPKPFSGGLSYTQFADSMTPSTIGAEFKNNFFSQPGFSPKADTEILIVDDFGTGQYTLPQFHTYSTVESLVASGTYRHGALVMYHANEVIKGSGLYGSASQSSTGQTVYTSNGRNLKVTPVNTQLASKEAIFNSLKVNIITTGRLVDILQDKGKDYLLGSKVFNLSFGIVPCEIYADFELSSLKTFREYIEKFVEKNYGIGSTNNNKKIDLLKEKEALRGIIESTNLPNDPLKQLIAGEANRHIFVAAAGNYGVDVSMYPANWPGVVNVTGSSVGSRHSRLATEFNKGEVMTVGSLFKITAPTGTRHLYYYGTSFATPSVSVYSALDLAGQQRCTDTNPQNLKSELALDGGSFTLADKRLESTYNPIYDLFSSGAVQTRCGSN
jgi:Subtilase family